MMTERAKQRGAVSLFVVIFAALLIIIVVTAFMRIMIQDQMQATASDLSRSAYDSAQAGVEDVKRAVTEYLECTNPSRCNTLERGLGVGTGTWTAGCDATAVAGVASLTSGEVIVRANRLPENADAQLQQAYTCVKVNMQPKDVIGDKTYPLRPVKGETADSLEIEWSYQKEDRDFNLSSPAAPYKIPSEWSKDKPSILRVQLIQYKNDFRLSDFDAAKQTAGATVYNRTLFFIPTSSAATAKYGFLDDARPNEENNESANLFGAVKPGRCGPVKAGNYACKAEILLPEPISGDTRAYLKIDRLYPTGDSGPPKVAMKNSTSTEPVAFDRVQVAVDVTGRANDIFKRIRARLDIGGTNLPLMAVDTTKSLCKDFAVTDSSAVLPSGYPADCPALPN